MPEFLNLLPPSQAITILLEPLSPLATWVDVPTVEAIGRISGAPVIASHPLPPFSRSTVDGYAIRAADTYGATESSPAYLNLVGEIPMGDTPGFQLLPGQCASIHTGGMLPAGADSVVMLEYCQPIRQPEWEKEKLIRAGELEVLRAVANGENMIEIGEDVTAGQEVIPPGVRLRPAEIGGLMALGITHLAVARKPRIALLSSGDEIVAPEASPFPGQVRDVNSYSLSALVQEAGGEPILYGILPDKFEVLLAAARRALAECDMLVITAGSSASTRDLTARVINSLGEPGVLVHGVNIRPGKPTILGVIQSNQEEQVSAFPHPKPVIGLPGNPVSALVVARLFVVPVIDRLLGVKQARLHPSVRARLTTNLASQAGREDWVPVRLVQGAGGCLMAEPVFGKSNLIFTLSRAGGLVRILPDATGLDAGEEVEVVIL